MSAPRGNQNARGNRGGTGRPPVYNARIPNIVRGLRERGATEHEIADLLGISDRTLRQWRAQHIEFSAALNVSNEAMVKRARESLYHRAVGYSYESEKVQIFSDGSIVRAPIIEHVPPDTTAALKILERLDPETWRERTETKNEHTFSWAKLVEESMSIKPKALEPPAQKITEGEMITKTATVRPGD